MEAGKKILFDIKKSGSSFVNNQQQLKLESSDSKINPDYEKELEFDDTWEARWDALKEKETLHNMNMSSSNNFETIREQKTPTTPIHKKSFATLQRLEHEDVEDKNNVLHHYGAAYFEVVDPELKTFFLETFGEIDNLFYTSNNYVYIGREDRVFRKPIKPSNYQKELENRARVEDDHDDPTDVLSSQLAKQSLTDGTSVQKNEEIQRVQIMKHEGADCGAIPKSTNPLVNIHLNAKKATAGGSTPVLKPATLLARQNIYPPKEWKDGIYSDIQQKSRNEQASLQADNFDFVDISRKIPPHNRRRKAVSEHQREFQSLARANPSFELNHVVDNEPEFNFLTSADLERMEGESSSLKSPEFKRLKEAFLMRKNILQSYQMQNGMSRPMFLLELRKPVDQRNNDIIENHNILQAAIRESRDQLLKVQKELQALEDKKSPYVTEIKVPKFGKNDLPQTDILKMLPIVKNDDDISLRNLYDLIVKYGTKMQLSEDGYKYAITSRLKGKRAKAWLALQKYPLKEAITSLISMFDKQDSSFKYATKIQQFKKLAKEDVNNSITRLIKYCNKAHPTKSEEVLKVLRCEIIMQKLDKLLSPRAIREIFRISEKKAQLGEELSEKELIDTIITEDMFDQRSEGRSFVELHNMSKRHKIEYDSDQEYRRLSDSDSDFEINAIEHKRGPIDDGTPSTYQKQAKTDSNPEIHRKFLNARRSSSNPEGRIRSASGTQIRTDQNGQRPYQEQGRRPIMVGKDNNPYIKVNSPNPNNKWHQKFANRTDRSQGQSNASTNRFISEPRRNLREFLSSRNAPLAYKDNRNEGQNFQNRGQNSSQDNRRFWQNRENQNTNQRQMQGFQQQRTRHNSWPNQARNRYNSQNQGANFVPLGTNRYNNRAPFQNENRPYQNESRYQNGNRMYQNSDRFGNQSNRFQPNRGYQNDLKHNMQVNTNPPSIFQQISMGRPAANALCLRCPKDQTAHSQAQCPRNRGNQDFRQSRFRPSIR